MQDPTLIEKLQSRVDFILNNETYDVYGFEVNIYYKLLINGCFNVYYAKECCLDLKTAIEYMQKYEWYSNDSMLKLNLVLYKNRRVKSCHSLAERKRFSGNGKELITC